MIHSISSSLSSRTSRIRWSGMNGLASIAASKLSYSVLISSITLSGFSIVTGITTSGEIEVISL
ncbi:MAG: hypothetical protein RLN90_01180 [Balneolaceae bacterium]